MSEFLPLINFVKTFSELNDEDEVLIQKYFQKETFKKNEIILNAGEICQKIYFINKGILRTFHTNQNGSEFTRLFAKENEFCTILISFSEKVGSPANIQALENSEIFSIKKSYFQEFISKSEKGERQFSEGILEKAAELFGCSVEYFVNESIEFTQMPLALRTKNITIEDLNAIAAMNKIALNLKFMEGLLERE